MKFYVFLAFVSTSLVILTPDQRVGAFPGMTKELLPGSRPSGGSICHMPPYGGPCRADFTRFYYDAETNSCREFVYGGCKSNGNNFEYHNDCMAACATILPARPGPRLT